MALLFKTGNAEKNSTLSENSKTIMIFSLYFAISYNTKTNKYHQQKEQNSFHFLIPLDVLCFILAKISPKSSIPAVAGPSGLLMSGNK